MGRGPGIEEGGKGKKAKRRKVKERIWPQNFRPFSPFPLFAFSPLTNLLAPFPK
jgi:hypothetical protein